MVKNEKLGSEILEHFNELYSKRSTWNNHWQLIGEFIHGTKQEFVEKHTAGQRLDERHTSDGVFAANQLASALIGMLWPNGGRSMELIPSDNVTKNAENKAYFEKASERMTQALDDPKARLTVALDEYMLDQVCFGTSGIGLFDGGTDSDLFFEPWGTGQIYIEEGAKGSVDVEIKLCEWTLRRIAATFGVENLSDSLQKKYKEGKNLGEKVEIIHAVKPRTKRDATKKDNRNMPYMSVYVERQTKHVIRERGFAENPVKITRFRKLAHEEYGRSPGMNALSDVLELDYLAERFTINVDKAGDPPLIVLDDGRFGGNIIDTSPRAINVIDVSGRIANNIDPIKPMFTVGELNTTLTRMQELRNSIAQHFYLDKLLDFNNQVQMTASEAFLRDRIRSAAIGSIFNRQIAELFNPLISRAFNMMLVNGKLGVVSGSKEQAILEAKGEEAIIIPDEIAEKMAKGVDTFEIRYFTPAARVMQAQQVESLTQLTIYKQSLQATNPEAADYFDDDKAIKMSAEVAGLSELLRSEQEVMSIREQRAQAQQAMAQAQQENMQSQSIKNLSDAGVTGE